MHKEAGERRDFLPTFVRNLAKLDTEVVLEDGYGSGMGIEPEKYLRKKGNIRFADHKECYQQDFVLVLRYPNDDELKLMKRGTCLISMVHYPTRPERVAHLKKLGLEAISLDSVCDDQGRRFVENLQAVGWNGAQAAFQALDKKVELDNPDRPPIRVTVMGVGMVGSHAIMAASRYGDPELWKNLASSDRPGVIVTAVDYDVTGEANVMAELISRTDILIDATQRPDNSKYVIPNEWVGVMPEHAVLLDLSVDPYDCSLSPQKVKGIEGIPQGSLDQYVFFPDDPAFDALPSCVNNTHRRISVSNYSWPGVHPEACMAVYGNQILPLVRNFLKAGGVSGINPQGMVFHRAIARGMVSNW